MKKIVIVLLAFSISLVLVACAEKNVTVTFNSDGGTAVVSQEILEGTKATSPIAPTKDGFNFSFWVEDGSREAFDFNTKINSNKELTAIWTQEEVYNVTFNSDGGPDVTLQSVIENSLATAPDAIEKAGYDFVHWYSDFMYVEFDFSTPITENILLSALWEEKDIFEVSFDSNIGSRVSDVDVYDGGTLVLPEAPTEATHDFVHWYVTDDSVEFDLSTPITEDITLTAKWEEKTSYVVAFEVGSGSYIFPQVVMDGYLATETEVPEYYGYSFVRWYETDDTIPFDFSTPITENVILNALWTVAPIYEVSFDSTDGSLVESQNIIENQPVMEPRVPVKAGYSFTYWYVTDEMVPYDFTTPVTGEVTLQAYWILLPVYNVSFNSGGGSTVEGQVVIENDKVVLPVEPTKVGYSFLYWYDRDSSKLYDMHTPITEDITFTARWGNEDQKEVIEDINDYSETIYDIPNFLPTPPRGAINNSTISYTSESFYISEGGIVLPLLPDSDIDMGTWRVEFTIDDITFTKSFDVPLFHVDDVVIAETRVVPFENMTTEYDVMDTDVSLYFEQNGYVPYIKVEEYFELIEGVVDPELPMTFTQTGDILEIFYQYYDEDEDYTYDLTCIIDATENTLTTDDPGFYWAYVTSSETNYGRHLEYIDDHPNESYREGTSVVYDLDEFNMDVVMYEDEILIPYYIANQLFATGAYYNIYYNYDKLIGFFFVPADGSKELRAAHTSSMSNENLPADLLIHTFDFLAFTLDNLYGLKDIMEVDTYYDMLFEMKDDLLVTDAEDLELGLRDLLLLGLDEGHTSYQYHSYYNGTLYSGPAMNRLEYYGPRFVQRYYDGNIAVDDAIADKFGESLDGSWNANVKPYYWFLDAEMTTVMITINSFDTADIEESATHDAALAEKILDVPSVDNILPTISMGNKFFYYNNSTEEDNVLDIVVKGVEETYVATYIAALLADGYVLVQETTTDAMKTDGYYTKTVDEVDYLIIVHYDTDYSLLHVGVVNKLPTEYSSSWMVEPNVIPLGESDSAVYLEFILQEIEEENPDVANVILDLSWNGGGNVAALWRVLGFMTNEPFGSTDYSGLTGSASTSYMQVTGVPDYSHLNWYTLITPVTYSAANELANLMQFNDIGEVIGVQAGGGACSLTPVMLPNGTAFTMSSNSTNAYRTGTGTVEDPYEYHDTEFGIFPDIEIDIDDIYNSVVWLEIINGND